MKSIWIKKEINKGLSEMLQSKLGLPFLLSNLLSQRIDTIDEANDFINPSIDNLPSPLSIKGIKEASAIICTAVRENKKITVFGDYDADGVTGSSILVNALKIAKAKVDAVIPCRKKHGYGLNNNLIKEIYESGSNLLITVDCGITNTKEVAYARKIGMNVVITDHHSIPEELPKANAIVNPKLNEKDNPYYQLAGTGVAFMLASIFLHHLKINTKLHFDRNLEIAAIGTVADMVPLKKANRTIVSSGLKKMNENPSHFINLLCNDQSVINSGTIGFTIGPKINAAGRIDDARHSFELLTSEDMDFTEKKADELTRMNDYRKDIGYQIKESALNLITREMKESDKVIIASSENWHPGIIGIAASQLANEKKKPVVLIAKEEEYGRGSARSFGDIDIYKYLNQLSDLFNKFGGHKQAAGFEIPLKNIKEFKLKLIELMNKEVSTENLTPKLEYDMDIKLNNINMSLIKELETLAPFGIGNSEPIFKADNLFVLESRLIHDKHIKMKLSNSEVVIDAIAFNMPDKYDIVKQDNISILFTAEVNEFRNQKTIQLRVIDIKQSK